MYFCGLCVAAEFPRLPCYYYVCVERDHVLGGSFGAERLRGLVTVALHRLISIL